MTTFTVPFETCPWLVEVPSGNPEPDSPADCWMVVECGAAVSAVPFGWECEAGHGHVSQIDAAAAGRWDVVAEVEAGQLAAEREADRR